MRAWEDFLLDQEKELGLETVAKWLRPLKIIRFDSCNLYLEAVDAFKILWFEEHVRHRVQTLLLNNNNKKIKVHLSVAESSKIDGKPISKKGQTLPSFKLPFDELDEKNTLDDFLVSSSNMLAFKLLAEVAGYDLKTKKFFPTSTEKLVPTFNPIYIFGRSGIGKTHLLQATALLLKKRGMKALFLRSETFTEHVVAAIRTGEMQTFRKTYRNIDALLIDDVEIFGKKGATQEEFFHTFNTLHVEGKPIILSASSAPQELKFIEERIVSRFEWGVVVPIQKLEKEKMVELVQKKATQMNFILTEEILDFLITHFSSNTKATLRALDALILRTHLNKEIKGKFLTKELVKTVLSDLLIEEEKALLTPTKIVKTVAEYYGIRSDDILGKSQIRECALPRQIAMHLCRTKLNLPFMKIGDIFERDHSTVMASVKQIQKEIDEKTDLSSNINSIIKRLD